MDSDGKLTMVRVFYALLTFWVLPMLMKGQDVKIGADIGPEPTGYLVGALISVALWHFFGKEWVDGASAV